jgi:hypothetical protein
MTSRAADRETQHCAAGPNDDFIEGILSSQTFGDIIGSDLTRQQHR